MLVIPALWEAKAGGSLELRSSKLAWPTWRNPVSKISQASATREAEAGEWHEAGRQSFQ